MSKLNTIIKREYLSRVKTKTFIILTFLTPALFILIFLIPIWMSTQNKVENVVFGVIDNSGELKEAFVSSDKISFEFIENQTDTTNSLEKYNYDAIIKIPEDYRNDTISIFSQKPVPLAYKQYIKYSINNYLEQKNLIAHNIDPAILQEVKENIPIQTYEMTEDGKIKQTSSELNTGLGFISAFMIYMFIFIFGAALMKGAMEEKSNRIVEILVSSVKSFDLMLGKIIGVALVAFTQVALWVIPVIIFIFASQNMIASSGMVELQLIITALQNVNLVAWLLMFLFYFVGGYLLYGSMFAAVGAAVDNQTDTQQFMLPITIPLILAFVFAQSIIENPSGDLAVWFSIIPFTSPVVMPVRFGFAVPMWQMLLSAGLLILTFLLMVYIAAKIYRIGILSYGKKITYADLWKWIRTK